MISALFILIAIIGGILWVIGLLENKSSECDPDECKKCPFPCDKHNDKRSNNHV